MRSSSLESLNKVTYTPITESNGTGATISLINNVWVRVTQHQARPTQN